jgi:hypothetical protein
VSNIASGIDFARALGEHFSLPANTQADIAVNAGADEFISVTVKTMLTADDLAAIAQRMPGATPPAKAAALTEHAAAATRVAASGKMAADARLDWLVAIGRYRQAPASAIGFDAWMRARTEAAHAAYMAGHAAGGIAYT